MKQCVNCGSDNFSTLYRFLYGGDTYYGGTARPIHVMACAGCGLIRLEAATDGHDAQDIHDFWWEKTWLDTYKAFHARIIKSFDGKLDSLEGKTKGRNILDIGCGCGFFLAAARARGWKTAGIDISQPAIDYANTVLGLSVKHADSSDAGFADNAFDVVTMWDVIEHLEDPVAVLAQARRVLKPGGIIVIETPNAESLFHGLAGLSYRLSLRTFRYLISRIYIPSHVYYFSRATLGDMLRRCGLEPEAIRHSRSSLFSDLDILFAANRSKEVWARNGVFKTLTALMLRLSDGIGRPYRITAAARKA